MTCWYIWKRGWPFVGKRFSKSSVEIQYARNDTDFHRGTFRARGDVIEIFPASSESKSVRIELFGDVVDAIHEIDPFTGKSLGKLPKVADLSQYALFDSSRSMGAGIERDRRGA